MIKQNILLEVKNTTHNKPNKQTASEPMFHVKHSGKAEYGAVCRYIEYRCGAGCKNNFSKRGSH